MIEYCVCGHSHWEHRLSEPNKFPYCQICLNIDGAARIQIWHEFKLDNLRLIEDLAKEKGLV